MKSHRAGSLGMPESQLEPGILSDLIVKEQLHLVLKCLMGLPPQQSKVVYALLNGVEQHEYAKQNKLSKQSVSNAYTAAVATIRKSLKQSHSDTKY